MYCAECGVEVTTEYYKCLDNFLQVKYFEEQDESDNIFCSQECFCQSLILQCIDVDAARNGDPLF